MSEISSKKNNQRNISLDDYGDIEIEEPDLDDVPMSAIMNMIRNLPEGYRTSF